MGSLQADELIGSIDALPTQSDALWDPDPFSPDLYFNDFSSSFAQQLMPATLAYQGQSFDEASGNSLENHKARVSASTATQEEHKQRTSYEHRMEANRRAQKRFRERRKERGQALDAQLAETRAELSKLKARQQQLESRNALLEKISHVNKQQTAVYPTDRQDVCDETSTNEEGRGVNITLPRHEQVITVQQISNLSLEEFAALWTEYIRELGMLLVHLGNRHDPATQASLERLTVESTQLLGCLKAFSPAVYRSVCQGRLDADHTLPAQELDVSWFASLQEVLFLSDAQMQDFAFLRRLYLTKRAVLAFERKKLVEQLHINSSTLPHPAEGELNASDLAGKLRQNAREDYEVYIKIGYAVRRGVFSTKQWAMFIVLAYPFFPGVEAALENTFSQSSEPTMQQIIADARADPKSEEWSVLDDYLCRITGTHPHGYEPIPRPTGHSSNAAGGKQAPEITLQDMLR